MKKRKVSFVTNFIEIDLNNSLIDFLEYKFSNNKGFFFLISSLLLREEVILNLKPTKTSDILLFKNILSVFSEISFIFNIDFYLYISNVKTGELCKYSFTSNSNEPIVVEGIEEIFPLENTFFNNLKRTFCCFTEPFYSPNYPEEKNGYKIKTISEDYYQYIKKRSILPKQVSPKKTHLTNYIKWHLTEDLSIRYFYNFEDDTSKEYKFFLKSHQNKFYVLLSEEEATHLIIEFNCDKVEQIIGCLVGTKYKKTIYELD